MLDEILDGVYLASRLMRCGRNGMHLRKQL